MRKLIAAINMTRDGVCDHTAVIADGELHQHYNEVMFNSDTILYGRKTYQLMEYWQSVANNPTGNKAMDEFAITIENISKVVFSTTLKDETIGWKNVRVAKHSVEEEVSALKHQERKDILVGSPGLIITCLKLNLVDELQLCVHPVVAAKGLPLFKNISQGINFKLLNTKTFSSGAIVLYYEPIKK